MHFTHHVLLWNGCHRLNDSKTNSADIIAPPPVLYLGALISGLVIQIAIPLAIPTSAFTLRMMGLFLLILSGAFARWAFVTMGQMGTSASPREQSSALVTHGPFKVSRNPIYVAMTGLYLGISLLVDSLWPLLFLIPLLVIMHWGVILREERYLARQFGEPYLAYKSSTRRWL
jgi:protein-S-isoprenylcysteine O-methyltransferase Ste14